MTLQVDAVEKYRVRSRMSCVQEDDSCDSEDEQARENILNDLSSETDSDSNSEDDCD